MSDWRTRELPDGRTVEFINAEWAPDDGTEPPGTIPVKVTYAIDGVIGDGTVLLTSEQVEAAFGDAPPAA
jgi:hypothetical protein